MIHIRCACGALYHADERQVGKRLRCSQCQEILAISSEKTALITPAVSQPIISTPVRVDPIQIAVKPERMSSTFIALMGLALVIVLVLLAAWQFGSRQRKGNTLPAESGVLAPKPPSVKFPEPPGAVNRKSHPISPKHFPALSGGIAQHRERDLSRLAAPKKIRLPLCAQGQPIVQLFTGEKIEEDELIEGYSTLLVTNGTGYDAAVRLVDSFTGRTVRFMYVQGADAYKVSDIEPGSYRLIFMTGSDWVTACRGFLRNLSYSEFEKELVFEDSSTEDEDSVTTWTTHGEVTLNPVVGGKAKIRKIDRRRFFEGDQHVAVDQ